MARTISFVKGKGSINHNNRDFIASNVDASRSSMNITYIKTPIDQAYDQIFGEALRDYNAKQKRKDRKIDDYLSHIKQSKNNEKIFYENVVQIGKRDDTGILDKEGNITDEALLAREILDEYARTFQERNPNLILFNAVLHMDEATPHLHLDYIPVAHSYKTGLSTRNSLTKGLQEMGIEPAKGKKDNETMHWQQRERWFITELCRKRGLEIEVLGIDRDDYSLPEFKAAMRAVDAAEAEIEILNQEKEEIQSFFEQSEYKVNSNKEKISSQEQMLEDINKQIKEAEVERRSRLEAVEIMIGAEKSAEHATQVIELNSTEVKPLFGKETMVKVPKNLYDRLLENYKAAKTYERMYESYYTKCSRQESIIQRLEATIQDLTGKIKQFTSFIEAKGLAEAFKEFLNPPKVIEKVKSVRDNLSEYRKAKPRSTPAKNRDSWTR